MMDRLNTTSTEYGMKINIKKTKVLKISKGKETAVRIHIGGKQIEQVKEFCYLGSMITTDAKCHREIKRRIAKGKEAFSNRRELVRGETKQESKDKNDKDTSMERGAVWIGDMDNEKSGYKKTGN